MPAISFVGPLTPLDVETPQQIFPGKLYVDPSTYAADRASALAAAGRTADATLLRRISQTPSAVWLGDWFTTAQLRAEIARHVSTAASQGATPVFVTYAIPDRDCGSYSAGGLSTDAYLEFTRTIAAALRGSTAAVIVEPDAIAGVADGGCPIDAAARLSLIRDSVGVLADSGVAVYLDAGHSNWVTPEKMRDALQAAGIDRARGFSTNVSNFYTVAEESAYAERLSYLLGGKHYVIDVSRNGSGSNGEWCNPTGMKLGQQPSVGGPGHLDALLWVKHPGESDGTCNGGPPSGSWWESYALALAR